MMEPGKRGLLMRGTASMLRYLSSGEEGTREEEEEEEEEEVSAPPEPSFNDNGRGFE
jgi:hypothetical protein